MSCACQKGLNDSATDAYSSCVESAWQAVNYYAQDANGNYVCRDYKNPCYLVDDVEKVLYIYGSLVKKKLVPVYDPKGNPTKTGFIEQKVAIGASMDSKRVAAILWNLYWGVDRGEIEEKSCLDPIKDSTQIWIYFAIAAVLAGGGYVLIKRKDLAVKLKNKIARKKK